MVFKCKICGGNLDVNENSSIITCDYCGTKQTLPKLENDKVANLYDRANHFRRSNEYDKAEALYEMILNENSKDAESYWSILLCKYGVEYVKDPKTKEYIPTCNRTQKTSILTDENYKQALKYATEEQKEIYIKDAEKINNIQKGILEISNKEEPFDIFICYKETDENGNRTQDSVIAQDLYNTLQKEGLKVFFAKITLENKIGESYEPYIYAALNSSKVMLVIGTKKEYLESIWVKNEWSRYLNLIKNGENKTLIPCFKGINPYDLPEDFAYLQSQDMSKIGFEQDLLHGIKKLINTDTKKKKSKIPIIAVTTIIAIIITIIGVFILSKPQENIVAKSESTKQIVRQDINSYSGYTFNTKVEDLKNYILEEINNAGIEGMDARKLIYFSGGDGEEVLAIGWLDEEPPYTYEYSARPDNFEDESGMKIVIGIAIFSDENGYVTGIICRTEYYGEEYRQYLSVPLNLYEKAKQYLGSEEQDWQKLLESEVISELTLDQEGNELIDGSFSAGCSMWLDI